MLIKQSENFYYMPAVDELDKPILGYVKGDKYSLMIDSGISKEHAEEFLKDLEKLDFKMPDFLIITHCHWDHIFGMSAINALKIGCNKTNVHLEKMKQWEWSIKAMDERVANKEESKPISDMIKEVYPDVSKITIDTLNITFDTKMTINLGGIECQLIKVNDYHTDDSIIIYIPQEKIVFLGDWVYSAFKNTKEENQSYIHEIINYLEKLDFEIGFISHEMPFSKQDLLQSINEI